MLIKISTAKTLNTGISKIIPQTSNGTDIEFDRVNVISHNATHNTSQDNFRNLFTRENTGASPRKANKREELFYLFSVDQTVRRIFVTDWNGSSFACEFIYLEVLDPVTQEVIHDEKKYFSTQGKQEEIVFQLPIFNSRLLFKKDNQYGYYTDSFQSLGTTYPTKEQFEQYGMSDLSMLEARDIPVEYEMELINQTEEEKFFSYTFDLNGQHKNMKSIDGIITE